MSDLRLTDLFSMQTALWEQHRDTWSPMEPSAGRDFILYMIEEIGKCVAILKKKGDRAVVDTPAVRARFIEEMSDVLMYLTDTLLRYGVTSEEFSDAYLQKHARNLDRDYEKGYRQNRLNFED